MYGVGPLAKNTQVKRLVVNGSCSVATAPAFGHAEGVITVCRREPGSGTQTGASIYFNGQGCPVGYPFVAPPSGPYA